MKTELPKNEFKAENAIIDREMRARNFFIEHQGGGCIGYVRYLYVDMTNKWKPAIRVMATNTEGVDIPTVEKEPWLLGVHSDFHEEVYDKRPDDTDPIESCIEIKDFKTLLEHLDRNFGNFSR